MRGSHKKGGRTSLDITSSRSDLGISARCGRLGGGYYNAVCRATPSDYRRLEVSVIVKVEAPGVWPVRVAMFGGSRARNGTIAELLADL